MEGGRVSHSWCMCVVVMTIVGWMGTQMELVHDISMRDKARWLVVCREMPEHFQSEWGIHLLHPIVPLSRCAVLGRVFPELIGLPGKA